MKTVLMLYTVIMISKEEGGAVVFSFLNLASPTPVSSHSQGDEFLLICNQLFLDRV